MRALILGGTVFLGRHVAEAALRRGHELTLFTRGLHGAGLFPEAEHLRGDRREDDYGPSKAAAERAAEAVLPGRVASVRAGLIVGPYDGVYRLPWWIERISRGGSVPAPGDPGRDMQVIDARDLAAWMLDLAERRVSGTFSGTAPIGQTSVGELLQLAVDVTGSEAELTRVPEDRLRELGVEPWTEMPLWAPLDEMAGAWRAGTERAQAAGLRCRPVAETVEAVWEWLRDGGAVSDWGAHARPPRMSPEREAQLLA